MSLNLLPLSNAACAGEAVCLQPLITRGLYPGVDTQPMNDQVHYV